jgi:hypothetical protein
VEASGESRARARKRGSHIAARKEIAIEDGRKEFRGSVRQKATAAHDVRRRSLGSDLFAKLECVASVQNGQDRLTRGDHFCGLGKTDYFHEAGGVLEFHCIVGCVRSEVHDRRPIVRDSVGRLS